MGRRSNFADGYPQSARARSRPRQSELGQIPASRSNATLVRRIRVRSTINFACHPERSEGPHETSRITKSNLCNQSPKVRSPCRLRDSGCHQIVCEGHSHLAMSAKKHTFTLGIEEEFAIIDPETRELRSHIQEILEGGKIVLKEQIKPEMHQSVVELGTEICDSIEHARTHV